MKNTKFATQSARDILQKVLVRVSSAFATAIDLGSVEKILLVLAQTLSGGNQLVPDLSYLFDNVMALRVRISSTSSSPISKLFGSCNSVIPCLEPSFS